jgi:hypothetical protein
MNLNFKNNYPNDDIALIKFLDSEVAKGWGISRYYISNPTWNILGRALVQANLIPKHYEEVEFTADEIARIEAIAKDME